MQATPQPRPEPLRWGAQCGGKRHAYPTSTHASHGLRGGVDGSVPNHHSHVGHRRPWPQRCPALGRATRPNPRGITRGRKLGLQDETPTPVGPTHGPQHPVHRHGSSGPEQQRPASGNHQPSRQRSCARSRRGWRLLADWFRSETSCTPATLASRGNSLGEGECARTNKSSSGTKPTHHCPDRSAE